jgi:hypothetical protein
MEAVGNKCFCNNARWNNLSYKAIRRIFIIFSLLIFFCALYICYTYHLFEPQYYEEVMFKKDGCFTQKKKSHVRDHIDQSEECLIEWINSAKSETMLKVLDFFGNDLYKRLFSDLCLNPLEAPLYFKVIKNSPLLHYMHHAPHFATLCFKVISIFLWSSRQSKCSIKFGGLIVDNSAKNFWDTPLQVSTHAWVKDLVDISGVILNSSTVIVSNGCADIKHRSVAFVRDYPPINDSSGWFLHPSDAFIVGSVILGDSFCKYRGSAKKLLTSNTSLAVINRRDNRQILGVVPLLESIYSTEWFDGKSKVYISPPSSSKNMVAREANLYFEKSSLRQQAMLMREIDVLVLAHGAAEVNIAWMKPCSVLIEVFPWAFFIPDYFGNLAKTAGVLHYPIQVKRNATVCTKLFAKHSNCPAVLQKYLLAAATNKTASAAGHHSSSHHHFQIDKNTEYQGYHTKDDDITDAPEVISYINDRCYKNDDCRSCTRDCDGAKLSFNDVQSVLRVAIKDRRKCILNHPYLNSNKDGAGD